MLFWAYQWQVWVGRDPETHLVWTEDDCSVEGVILEFFIHEKPIMKSIINHVSNIYLYLYLYLYLFLAIPIYTYIYTYNYIFNIYYIHI